MDSDFSKQRFNSKIFAHQFCSEICSSIIYRFLVHCCPLLSHTLVQSSYLDEHKRHLFIHKEHCVNHINLNNFNRIYIKFVLIRHTFEKNDLKINFLSIGLRSKLKKILHKITHLFK